MEGKAGYSLECKGNRVTGRGLAVQIMSVRCCFVFEGQDPTFNQNTCMHVLGIQGFRLGLAVAKYYYKYIQRIDFDFLSIKFSNFCLR